MNHVYAFLVVVSLVASCTKENAAFCCIDPADCAAKGVDEERLCTDGLACIENQCVAPACATTGCAAAAPVCEVTTDTCVGCTSSSECSRFPATDVCDEASGSCVDCVSAMDCAGATPICEQASCRGCRADSECDSGACASDGACLSEAATIYLSPQGVDTPPCSRTQPCLQLFFALQQVNATRGHIVFAPGNYTLYSGPQGVGTVVLHGHDATLTGGSGDGFLALGAATLQDLDLVNPTVGEAAVVSVSGNAVLTRVRIRGGNNGIQVSAQGSLMATDVKISVPAVAIRNSGTLVVNRLRVEGGVSAIISLAGSSVDVTNMLTFDTTDIALDLDGTGTIAFSTIHSEAQGTQPPGVRCASAALSLRSSIVWSPTFPVLRAGVAGPCQFASTIAGPFAIAGATNTDPFFVDAAANNFHISGGSPARDMVDVGPATDFEGDPRPRGARFDLGADEAP